MRFKIVGDEQNISSSRFINSQRSLEKMKRRLRGCDYFTVENAGHSIHKTHKDAFSNIVDGVCRQAEE